MTSAAARSGVLALAAFVIMGATWYGLMPGAPLQHRIDGFGFMFTKPAWWATALLGWLGLFAWMWFAAKAPVKQRSPPWSQMGWWIVSAVAAAIAMAALTQSVNEVSSRLHGMRFPTTWRSVQRLLEAALLAVVIVRLARPLSPRFDKPPSRAGEAQ
jgi:hypothetical protein